MRFRRHACNTEKPSRIPLAIYAFGAISAVIDMSVAAIMLPAISAQFKLEGIDAQWTISVNLIAGAMSIPMSGWATRRWGVRTVWMGALAAFGIGSALASIAPSFLALLCARFMQGAAGGLILPVGQTLVLRVTRQAAIGRTLGAMNVPLLIGPILGPVMASTLIAAIGWRGIFLVGIPFVLIALFLTSHFLTRDEVNATPSPPDVIGFALLSPGLAAIIWASVTLRESISWPPIVVGGVGLIAIGTFILRSAHRDGDGILDFGLFRNRQFAAGAAVAFLFSVGNGAGIAFFVVWLAEDLGMSIGLIGLFIGAHGIGALVAVMTAGRAADRYGSFPVVGGGGIVATLATASMLLVGDDSSPGLLLAALIVRGFGLSTSLIAAYAEAYRGLDANSLPDATAALNMLGRVGGAVGVSYLFILVGFGNADPYVPPVVALVICTVLTALISPLLRNQG